MWLFLRLRDWASTESVTSPSNIRTPTQENTRVTQHLHTYTQQHPKTYEGKYTYVKQHLHTYTGKYPHKKISAHIPRETHICTNLVSHPYTM